MLADVFGLEDINDVISELLSSMRAFQKMAMGGNGNQTLKSESESGSRWTMSACLVAKTGVHVFSQKHLRCLGSRLVVSPRGGASWFER